MFVLSIRGMSTIQLDSLDHMYPCLLSECRVRAYPGIRYSLAGEWGTWRPFCCKVFVSSEEPRLFARVVNMRLENNPGFWFASIT